jgi:hypothetical protein
MVSKVGSRAEVFHGTKERTTGGLKKKDLMMHKGRIVSRKKHAQGKKSIKRLFALGYKPKKGRFTLMRKSMRTGKKTRRHRGGAAGTPENFFDPSGAPSGMGALTNALGGLNLK